MTSRQSTEPSLDADGKGLPGPARPAPLRPARASAVCERLLAYARALRLPPGEYLALAASVMDEGPPELPRALDLLQERAGLAGAEGIMRLAEGLPPATPPISRTPMASEKL